MIVVQLFKKISLLTIVCFLSVFVFSQDTSKARQDSINIAPVDSPQVYHRDTVLRITNLTPFFTLHVDSTLSYQLQVNKNQDNYFWYIRNSPVGLRINKDNGLLTFRADKSYFLSGKLKYDVNYKVIIGVQNIADPAERIDTSFTMVFYSTEIVPSRVKPAVSGTIWAEEGELIEFRVLCEAGSFPIEDILSFTSTPIKGYKDVQRCGDVFQWVPNYDVVKDSDSGKVKIVNLYFIGSTKFKVKDTATVKLVIKDALNYPLAKEEYSQAVKNVERYVLQLKFTFLQLDKKLKKTKNIRTTFDLTSATTSLTGTILGTSSSQDAQRTGKILPSIGLAMVPIKEASVPNKNVDQNQASSIRSSIKRLEYVLRDNTLLGERDWEITRKTAKLKEELKQVQIQLIDVPVELTNDFTEEELNRYFNSPKVNKKYRLKTR